MSYSGIFAIQLSRLESREGSLSYDFNETVMVYLNLLYSTQISMLSEVELGVDKVCDIVKKTVTFMYIAISTIGAIYYDAAK